MHSFFDKQFMLLRAGMTILPPDAHLGIGMQCTVDKCLHHAGVSFLREPLVLGFKGKPQGKPPFWGPLKKTYPREIRSSCPAVHVRFDGWEMRGLTEFQPQTPGK